MPLKYKLNTIKSNDIPSDWYIKAVDILRGGDGGEHGQLLYKKIHQYSGGHRRPVCLDVGTARGFSSLTMSRAILDAKLDGKIYTIDIIDHHQSRNWHVNKQKRDEPLSKAIMSRSQIWSKWFEEEATKVFPITGQSWDILKNWKYSAIDIAFLDGCHTYEAVKKELSLLTRHMNKEGVIIFDDYHIGEDVFTIPLLKFSTRIIGRVLGAVTRDVTTLPIGLRANNDFIFMMQKFYGIKKAIHEFLKENRDKWILEIITMPPRSKCQNKDYSIAILKKAEAEG